MTYPQKLSCSLMALMMLLVTAPATWAQGGGDTTDTDVTPEQIARECIDDATQIGEALSADQQALVVRCTEEIKALLEEGKVRKARHTLKKCLKKLRHTTRRAVHQIRRHCRTCVRVLRHLDADELADEVAQACRSLIERIKASLHELAAELKAVVDTPPVTDVVQD